MRARRIARRPPRPRQRRRWGWPRLAGVLTSATLLFCAGLRAAAQNEGVAATLHNLSVTGPGAIRSSSETEVCKFCHIPHNAVVPEPLWGHAIAAVENYQVPETPSPRGLPPFPQPDGSSRLCLSCHDGTVALGDVAGEPRPIDMVGAARLGPGSRGFLGTDLSGSHPISFVVPDGDPGGAAVDSDLTLRPLSAILADGRVRLDPQGKMQCTTCHDPHADAFYQPGRVPRFWVKPTVGDVCLTCHGLR